MLVSFAYVANGQDYVFRVLANKGTNKVKKAASSEYIPLSTGHKLKSGDVILAGNNAYIGIIHVSGKPLEIKTQGVYSVTELEAQIGNASTRVSEKYMGLLMDKVGDTNRSSNSNTDDPDRDLLNRSNESATIKMLIKETKNANKVYGRLATIKWEHSEGTAAYLITVKNIFNEVLLIGETSTNKATLDFTHERLANERFIIISVSSKDDPELKSRDFGIQRILPSEVAEFTSQFNQLRSELSSESALNKVILASFFEENKLYIDALTQFEEAVKMSPEVTDYKSMYEDFIIANGLGN